MKYLITTLALFVCMASTAQTYSLIPPGLKPAERDQNDGKPIEGGTKFRTSQPGVVVALSYYVNKTDTARVTLKLYRSNDKRLLASVPAVPGFGGLATMALDRPVHLDTGVTYLVSYYTPSGLYNCTTRGLDKQLASGPLYTVQDGSNGLYGYANAYPTSTYYNTNYFADVVFIPDAMAFDWSKVNDLNFSVYADVDSTNGKIKLPNGSLWPGQAFLSADGPYVYRFNYSGYQLTLKKDGTWYRRQRLADGTYKFIPY